MPSFVSSVIREQIRLLKPILTRSSIPGSRSLQEALGELGSRIVGPKVRLETFTLEDYEACWAFPMEAALEDPRVLLYLHGGGYVAGSIRYASGFASALAAKTAVRTLCIAYHLAPEDPYPAAVYDALTAYRYLLEQHYDPAHITLIGESAGGGLILSLCLLLRLYGLPLPGQLIPISPWTDLTLQGESYETKRDVDVCLTREELDHYAALYAGDLRDEPLVSPLLGDLRGLPPCTIFVGGDEILLDDSRRLHQKLLESGVESCLHIEPGMWHAYPLYTGPEAAAVLREIRSLLEVTPHG